MKSLFWKFYGCFMIILVAACIIFGLYVNKTLQEYEASQPEYLVEQQMDHIINSAKDNTLMDVISFDSLRRAEYDKKVPYLQEYRNKILDADQLSYKLKIGGYDKTVQQYQIFAEEEPVAVITLKSRKEEPKLAILTVTDWSVQSIIPCMTMKNYDYTVIVPNDFKVFINGHLMDTPEISETTDIYQLETLYSEPDIEIYDTFGCLAEYNIIDNQVSPVLHTYTLQLPETYTVSVNGTLAGGILKENTLYYQLSTACKTLTITDSHGNSLEYSGAEPIYAYDYELILPESFTVSLQGKDISTYFTHQSPNTIYQYCEEYTSMPQQNHYLIKDSLCEMSFDIYDNLGQKADYTVQDGTIEITKQSGSEDIPEELKEEIDVLDIAKKWSFFMTDDLEGSTNGFSTIKKYLIKDSYLYNTAYKWATGIDITFTSAHNTKDNYFTEEKVSNYISYSDTLFSCDISFVKHMYLYKKNIWVDDPMNSTFYFMKTKENDNSSWVIVDIQEIINVK